MLGLEKVESLVDEVDLDLEFFRLLFSAHERIGSEGVSHLFYY